MKVMMQCLVMSEECPMYQVSYGYPIGFKYTNKLCL